MHPLNEREFYYRENQEYITNNWMVFPLTLDFLRENRERVNWILALEAMKIPLKFLNEISEYIPYEDITIKAFQNLPEQFIKKHWNEIRYGWYVSEGILHGAIKERYDY